MKATKHSYTFDEDYKFYVRKQAKKNADMLRKAARRNKVVLQSVPLIIHDEKPLPPYAA